MSKKKYNAFVRRARKPFIDVGRSSPAGSG
jgi:hypothetical protein